MSKADAKFLQVRVRKSYTANVADNNDDREDASRKHSQPIKLPILTCKSSQVNSSQVDFNKNK